MPELKEETVDFAYAIDCTGSMSSYIQQSQKDIQSIVDQMKLEFPSFKLRLACVAYRDWCDDKRLESQNFTESVQSFKNYVGNLTASGGGDQAEDVLGGLNAAADLNWNSKLRVLFHICDAPPHNKIYHDGGAGDDHPDGHQSDPHNYHQVVIDKLKAKHIHLCIAKLNGSVQKMINVFKNYGKTIGLTIEERSVGDASQLLNAVKQTLVILTKMRREIKETQKEMDALSNTLSTLSFESQAFITETMNKMEVIDTDIKAVSNRMEEVERSVSDTKREYDELQSKHSVLMAYARNAHDADDVEKAENDVMELNVKLTKVNQTYSEAQDKVNETLKVLTEKQEMLRETDKTVTAHTKTKVQIKTEIVALTTKLDRMESDEARKELRKEIKEKFKDVRKLFADDAKMKKRILDIRKDVFNAFVAATKHTKHINECKRDVQSKINELDEMLDDLDDRT